MQHRHKCNNTRRLYGRITRTNMGAAQVVWAQPSSNMVHAYPNWALQDTYPKYALCRGRKHPVTDGTDRLDDMKLLHKISRQAGIWPMHGWSFCMPRSCAQRMPVHATVDDSPGRGRSSKQSILAHLHYFPVFLCIFLRMQGVVGGLAPSNRPDPNTATHYYTTGKLAKGELQGTGTHLAADIACY